MEGQNGEKKAIGRTARTRVVSLPLNSKFIVLVSPIMALLERRQSAREDSWFRKREHLRNFGQSGPAVYSAPLADRLRMLRHV